MWSWGACFFTFFYNQKLAPGYIDADYDNLTDPSAKCSSVIFHVQYKHRVIAAKMSTGIARRTQLASCAPPLLLAQLLHLEPEKIECPQLQERCHRAACRSKLSLFTLRFKIDTPYGVNGFAHIFALASGIICFGFMPGSPSTGWIADLIVRPSLGSKKPTRWLGCTARDTKQYEAIRDMHKNHKKSSEQKDQKARWEKVLLSRQPKRGSKWVCPGWRSAGTRSRKGSCRSSETIRTYQNISEPSVPEVAQNVWLEATWSDWVDCLLGPWDGMASLGTKKLCQKLVPRLNQYQSPMWLNSAKGFSRCKRAPNII